MSRKLIRLPQVRARCGNKSRAQIWRDVRNGTFPAPVEIGPNSKAWFDDEIDAWQENLSRVNYAPEQADVANDTAEEPEQVDLKPSGRKLERRGDSNHDGAERDGPADDGGRERGATTVK